MIVFVGYFYNLARKSTEMKNVNDIGLFDDHFLLETLSKLGDPLQKLNEYIDWSIFQSPLDQSFINEAKDLLKGEDLHSVSWYYSKPSSYKACIIFLMINSNFRLLTGQVLSIFWD